MVDNPLACSEDVMGTVRWPAPRDPTDEAIAQLLEYLALSGAVEAELEGLRPAIRRVIVSLLVADEAADRLTPFRTAVLASLQSPPSAEPVLVDA
jgi:hypothetical protein